MRWLVLFVSLAVFGSNRCAAENGEPFLNDQEIIRFLIGTIVVPPESSDFRGFPTVKEIFYKDGTYKAIIIDKNCREIKEVARVLWSVKNRILTSTLADGTVLRDEILAISGNTITLRSLDDGQTYLRKKVTNVDSNPVCNPTT